MAASESQAASSPTRKSETSNQFIVCFDQPTDWTLPVRWLRLTGWCVAANGECLTDIRALIGKQTFPGSFDRKRVDAIEHLQMPGASPWCGFTIDLQVPPGRNDLRLEVQNKEGRWSKAASRTVPGRWFTSQTKKEWQETVDAADLADASTRYLWWFDRPIDWKRPARTLHILGWCIDQKQEPIEGIRARVGGRVIPGNYGFERKDVVARYPQSPLFLQSGFAIAIPLRPGKAVVTLECKYDGGRWRPFFREEVCGAEKHDPPDESIPPEEVGYFRFDPRTSLRIRYWLDLPADWSKKVRHLHIAGWCLATSGEQVTAIRARIGRTIFPGTYGITRPDIAIEYEQRHNSLRSGFALDAILPRLPATLFLEAGDKNGRWEPFFIQRVQGPLFWGKEDESSEAVGKYRSWVRLYDRLSESDRAAIRGHIEEFQKRPFFSILLPVYNPNPKWLDHAIASVKAQLYPDWELCVVDDASTDPRIWKLIQRHTAVDPKIKCLQRAANGHICAASNDALAMATGEFITLLDHDDELAPTALYFAALELNRDPQLQLIYSDEDKLDRRGNRCDPYFKPDWNPDLLLSQNFVSHLGIYRTELVREVGGFRPGFEGSQDHDLVLRCIEKIDPSQIHHIPWILYHWRIAEQSTATFAAAKPYAHNVAIKAVQQHLDRARISATAEPDYGDYIRVRYRLPTEPPLVSLVIPTRDRASVLRTCLESIFLKTDYPNYEIVLIDNDSSEPATLEYFARLETNARRIAPSLVGRDAARRAEAPRRRVEPRTAFGNTSATDSTNFHHSTPLVRIFQVPGSFNYSRLNNFGVAQAKGSIVVLLNNDLEVINRGWLDEMVSQGLRPEIGAVGARLWYPDKTMQHGGVILGAGGIAGHAHAGLKNEHGYFARAHLVQNFSAVTAACMLVRKEVYLQLGGLDENHLAVAFNDVDFCLRLRERGFRVLWTPHAELFHYESASRGLEDTSTKQQRFLAEVDYMNEKWGLALESDPSYNPNLSLGANLFILAFPPRLTQPWRKG